MKVAYVTHHLRPNYEHDMLANMPVETVRFITTDKPPTSSSLGKGKVEYCQVEPVVKGWENRFFASTATRVFYKGYEKYLTDIDVVIVLEAFSSLSKQFVKYCEEHNTPVIVLVYELIDTHPIYKLPRYSQNTRFVTKHADHFIAVSQAASKHLGKLGVQNDKVSVVYPGIDVTNFKPNKVSKERDLIFVGKLEPHKGIDMVIQLYKDLVLTFPKLTMTLVGSGSWLPQVKELSRQYPGVRHFEHVANPQLPKTLNEHAIYLLPARDTKKIGMRIGAEQFGFTVVEAMACGLAVVTTDCGALAEIATSKNSIVRQNDSAGFQDATTKLLSDTTLTKKLGEYNSELAQKRYDQETQATALLQVINRVVKDVGTRREK